MRRIHVQTMLGIISEFFKGHGYDTELFPDAVEIGPSMDPNEKGMMIHDLCSDCDQCDNKVCSGCDDSVLRGHPDPNMEVIQIDAVSFFGPADKVIKIADWQNPNFDPKDELDRLLRIAGMWHVKKTRQ